MISGPPSVGIDARGQRLGTGGRGGSAGGGEGVGLLRAGVGGPVALCLLLGGAFVGLEME